MPRITRCDFLDGMARAIAAGLAPRDRRNEHPVDRFIASFPLSEEARRQVLELFTSKRVTLGHLFGDGTRAAYRLT